MTIRLATSHDKPEVLALFNEFSRLLAGAEAKPASSETFGEVIDRPDTMIWVAEEAGHLVGLVTFYLLPNIRHGGHRGHIEDFFVSESVRNTGVGRQLFNAVKDYARQHHIRVIKLDSGNELTDAHHFYTNNGGQTTERFFRFDLNS